MKDDTHAHGSARGEHQQLVEHFFRHESSRLNAALVRVFGWSRLELVEDMVQSALLEAMQHWKQRGIPDNPLAWIRTVAHRKVIDYLRREARSVSLENPATDVSAPDHMGELFADEVIQDSQLRLMFACCHPALSSEFQIVLVLKTLCGFSLKEIARGLLSTEEAMKKRFQRAKKLLVDQQIELSVPVPEELPARCVPIQRILYLLFHEGYRPSQGGEGFRLECCEEAIRLGTLLLQLPGIDSPSTKALVALMLLHQARLPGRTDPSGRLLFLEEQNRERWDWPLICRATDLLMQSMNDRSISRYHLEAGIIMLHCHQTDWHQTNWQEILNHYDLLMQLAPSPIYGLNRAIVVAQLHGPQAGLNAVAQIDDLHTLTKYHLLDATLGELHRKLGQNEIARCYFQQAITKTDSPDEKEMLHRRVAMCGG
ncbi:MAG: sigma-70 family RNA polymerase sigma factor [Zavarzinella sp.]